MPADSANATAGHAAKLGKAVQRYQASVTDFDREVARLLGVNETDLRCLEILLDGLEHTLPSALATRLGLTTGSVTAMLDRLEKLGYLTRSPHPTDRRKILVRATEFAARQATQLIGALLDEGGRGLRTRYSAEQLELIIDFLGWDTDLHQRHTERLRGQARTGRSGEERPPTT